MLSVRENSESMSGLYAFDIRFPLLKIYKFLKYSSIRLVLPSFHPNKLGASKDRSALKRHESAFLYGQQHILHKGTDEFQKPFLFRS